MSIALDVYVYGPYVPTNKSSQKVMIVECLNTVYGAMVAALLYYTKFVKSLTKEGTTLHPYDCVERRGSSLRLRCPYR